MSARKIDAASLNAPAKSHNLVLPTDAVCIRKNGIEFRNAESITPWTEMTVTLQGGHPTKKVNFTGVVVACSPHREGGHQISMLFMQISPLSQARLLGYS